MAISRPSVIRIALAVLTLWLPRHALAADRWAIPPGQEAVLEKALAPTAAWPKGWTFTGANIDHDAIDARYRDPTGLGLGVRLQHPQYVGGPRQAGQFEIASISAELPDDVVAQIKAQLAKVPEFKWLPLHDREGDAATAEPADATATAQAANGVQARGDALIAANQADHLLQLLAQDKAIDCATRQHWVVGLIATQKPALFGVANDLARQAPACPKAQQTLARWTATLGKPAQGEAILREVQKAGGDDPLVAVDLALLMRQQERCGEALAVLAKLDLAKVPGIASELARLSRIYIDCPDKAVLAAMRQRADAAQPDLIAAFIVGSILHHDGAWQESDKYLVRAEPLMKVEPREYLYRAMNAWHEGRQADAEQLVGHAATMGGTDPDVLYCRAMIFAERNTAQAIADLQAYDKAMAGTLDKTPGKQAHVSEILAELQACQGAKDLQRCRQLRQVSRFTVRWLPAIVVLALGIIALLRWRRRR